jgi:CRP-like cAMP-binding protein
MLNEKERLIHFIQSSGLVSQQGAAAIAGHFLEKNISKNDFLLKEGRICDEYLFLERGFMRSFTHDTNGDEVTTHFYAPNQIVFEGASYFNRTISRESIQALTDCEGWFITYEQLNMLFHSVPEFREFGRSILVKGFVALKQRMLSVINETAEERYAGLIKSNPEIFQNAPLKAIASYIGITDTSLSRIRKEFAKK